MPHLSFEEHQMVRRGGKIPLRLRIHLWFCKSCREELKNGEWDFLSEVQRHYLSEENRHGGSSPTGRKEKVTP